MNAVPNATHDHRGRTKRTLARVLAGAATVAATAALLSIGPPTATADPRAKCGSDSGGRNATATFDGGNYVAQFCARGEKLHVSDKKTDDWAAYAYVEVQKWSPNQNAWIHDESDSFKVTWQQTFGLDTPDSGSGMSEGKQLFIKVCKGPQSRGDCSGWKKAMS